MAAGASAQSTPSPEDVGTLDGIIRAYYEVVSGPAGQPRDWARDSTLHHPDALVTVVGSGPDGEVIVQPTDLAGFHAQSSSLATAGFFEAEIARRTERYGATAHVWSTYEWRQTETGPVEGRGVNSIQLVWDGARWWIISWMFDGRSDKPDVPQPYMPQ
ncbi:hypothetical protein BSZ36_13565 [Rubricoccus marinus]|uniref:SnoaL-like domain-containing protein n=1 Tax=Rubricoccus marinus TaxID=716817 RepID=A0A259U3Z6_9BACT|nr:hypothetical protein BSZ36_13565 [Rubricoccus marinus]